MRNPRLFSIPPSAPFLPTLIAALLEGRLVEGFPASKDPLALAQATLYLPTRRACRLAQDVFRQVLGTEAAILPRIVPIGDIDEDEIVFADIAAGAIAPDALALPPAIDGFERKALLTNLIARFAAQRAVKGEEGMSLIANSPGAAYALAGELARLQDDMITRGVDWAKLDNLVPDNLDKYFETTLEFLKIAHQQWPDILKVHGAIDAAERRDRLIDAEAARLQRAGGGPVIAAGSTGSMPSTAKLLATIARLPNGAVVLPGLDLDLDDESWNAIQSKNDPAPGHPQFSMHALLERLEVAREAVTELPARAPHGREILLSESLRPAQATDRWQSRLKEKAFADRKRAALEGITLIAAANPEEEALAIALALREAVSDGKPESRERSAALITPDRALARRVLAALARWNVPVDDSGGDALADTRAGIFARLAAELALQGCEPVTLLALLRHPLCRLGAEEFSALPAVAQLERAILRGPRLRQGADGLLHALSSLRASRKTLHRNDPRSTLSDDDLDQAVALAEKLKAALEPLASVKGPLPFLELATHHRKVVAALSEYGKNLHAAFADRDGEALKAVFDSIADSGTAAGFAISPSDYSELFRAIASERMVRRPGAPNARVRIYGPLEARLQEADRVVLGGLVETVWPPEPRSDPWLNRPMRHELGLDLPERRIGLSAHDFAQSLGAKEVFLAYPAKREGTPVVVSRFVQRLAAVAGEDWKAVKGRGENYLAWARTLDAPAKVEPALRPAPKPPVEARPKRLSVTEIEHWLRDPYTIYAKHVLKLHPLDPVDTPPGARDRGTVIHQAVGDFTVKFAPGLPADPLKELLALGREAFAPLSDYPEAEAFWWPRFERIARWFVEWEIERRKVVSGIFAETGGELAVTDDFLLTARADRIDLKNDNTLAVLDYKTGQPPTIKQVKSGLSPQLTLQAAMLRHGTFKNVKLPDKPSVSELLYLRLSGGDPGGKEEPRKFDDATVDEVADKALEELRKVVTRFASADQAYVSFARPMFFGRAYGDYDHLARVKEWSAGGSDDE
jgi:ATP-dependent helicase/nuclease subunit B